MPGGALRRLSLALRQRLVCWLLEGVRLPELRIGANTIDFNPPGATDCLRWSGTSTPGAKGDLGMNTATGSPRFHDGIAVRAAVGTDAAFSGAVQTTNATTTNAALYTPADGTAVTVLAHVVARRSTGAEGAGYLLCATFRRSGGTTTQIGSTTVLATHENVASWNATLDASGPDIRVRVTGAASSTINWRTMASVRSAA